MSIEDEAADYVDSYEATREQERIDRHLEVFTDAFRSDKWDRAKPVMAAYERGRVTPTRATASDADGFEAGEPWHLDLTTGEWHPGESPPLASGPTGTVTRITSGTVTVTFDEVPAVVPSREPGNRRARRAARARGRGRRRGGEPFLVPAKTTKATTPDDRGVVGTIVAVEGGVLLVRMPDGTVARIELWGGDAEGRYVVGGVVTIGGVKP